MPYLKDSSLGRILSLLRAVHRIQQWDRLIRFLSQWQWYHLDMLVRLACSRKRSTVVICKPPSRHALSKARKAAVMTHVSSSDQSLQQKVKGQTLILLFIRKLSQLSAHTMSNPLHTDSVHLQFACEPKSTINRLENLMLPLSCSWVAKSKHALLRGAPPSKQCFAMQQQTGDFQPRMNVGQGLQKVLDIQILMVMNPTCSADKWNTRVRWLPSSTHTSLLA